MKYRPEIDGLRSLAIIPVIFYHINNSYAPYGYLGVDVFFVISGYLIASIISYKINNDNFSVIEFYERRVKRIAPIYLLIITILIPLSFIFFYPSQIKDIAQSISASLLFVSNFFFYREIDYFNPFTEISPLIHTWSLGIEEQFYLFLPSILIFLKGKIKSTIIILIISISFIYYYYLSIYNPSLAFYSTFSRIWELLIGVFFAINPKILNLKSYIGSKVISFFALILLLTILLTNYITLDVSILRIIVVASTIILLIDNKSSISNLLSFRILTHIGLLSYSLYMIHQPILSILKNTYFSSEINLSQAVIIILIIYMISALSYYFFEKPIRYLQVSTKTVFITFFGYSSILFSFGFYAHKQNGFINEFLNKYENTYVFDQEKEMIKKNEIINSVKEKDQKFSVNKKNILIIGDSMAEDIFVSLNSLDSLKTSKIRLLTMDDLCFKEFLTHLETDLNETFECRGNLFYINDINKDILMSDVIIISAHWNDRTISPGANLSNYIGKVYNKKVLIVGAVGFSYPNTIALDMLNYNISDEELGPFILEKHLIKRIAVISEKIPQLITNENIYYLSKYDFFCNDKGCALFYSKGKPKIWDFGHLTEYSLLDYGLYITSKLDSIQIVVNKND